MFHHRKLLIDGPAEDHPRSYREFAASDRQEKTRSGEGAQVPATVAPVLPKIGRPLTASHLLRYNTATQDGTGGTLSHQMEHQVMAYLVGTDEAGYGPNLGPLVIAATVWEVPDDSLHLDLYEALGPMVQPKSARADDTSHLAIADSKILYAPGKGVGQLERGVLSALLSMKRLVLPDDWRPLFSMLAPDCDQHMDEAPWYRSFEQLLPLDADLAVVRALAEKWNKTLASAGIRLHDMQAVVCLPKPFNDAVKQSGSKGAVLSDLTLRLVQRMVDPIGTGAVLIHCDKHGGRNRYSHLLQDVFPEYLVEIHEEGRSQSVYRWGEPGHRFEARFVAKGEEFLPSALASMSAKYLRELAMKSFNAFWLREVPDIRPTAGYPVDAKRFRQQIAAAQKRLGIADPLLWRER